MNKDTNLPPTDTDDEFELKVTIAPLSMALGTILRSERKRLNMSQKEFAACGEVTSRTVIGWEKGATLPDLSELHKLSKHGVDLSRFAHSESIPEIIPIYTSEEILFREGEDKAQELSRVLRLMSIKLFENTEYTLINVESVLNSHGEQTGIRYFYTKPERLIYDESHALRQQFTDDALETLKANRHFNRG